MIKKLLVVAAAFAAGYVLGTRSGRTQVGWISDRATDLWNDPRVSRARTEAVDRTTSVARDARDRTFTAAADVVGRVGEARDNALADLPDDESDEPN
jgi:hypothetical protein